MTALDYNPIAQMGGNVRSFDWVWQNQSYRLIYEIKGNGTPILLLPAFSTVSSRLEMRGLADRLSSQFQVVALDWLGFGQSSRPTIDYNPTLYKQLLPAFVAATFDRPVAVVAAGHAASYAMQVAQQLPCPWSKMVLLAPTWKGPLRVMGVPTPMRDAVRELVRSPGIGQALYTLNTAPAFLKFMYRQHVYVNADRLTQEFMQQKYDIATKPGARFAPAAFVTGTLDPMESHEEFMQIGASLSVPTMVVIGEQSPAQSKAEMEAIAELPHIESYHIPGSLGLHEEYADEVAQIIKPFLQNQ
ncbi:alpha/beta hydrolase [Planktothrix agardhii 1029]|jgi:pimeloyl-ACP methyl ester carboxylesterase|uniref:Chloride peroxidase n=1 Tax=Planktothrix agardhii (strain NIVA-CYA 126/8) TaxID=388467 RepID=A0A073CGF9_PLAA1|nr:alpha/beta hydrolase [Planktothrix agardhii]KEI66763.1 Chloride peroxidase [Planktothrix agardhii NIVA-CYA 126/8]MCB8763803.1 alpha/beta hydrolase [Planktothrix agardhii 1809]MCB8777436.1 alpha/beta hydrolase [Planktothrix agardhii 1031]MCB8781860.1 alpha/beta hydrolase [Planktothrix agardhii 1808]MCF3568584.1 alpha/beta hydrolase [Planktothrix agardhii 1807]